LSSIVSDVSHASALGLVNQRKDRIHLEFSLEDDRTDDLATIATSNGANGDPHIRDLEDPFTSTDPSDFKAEARQTPVQEPQEPAKLPLFSQVIDDNGSKPDAGLNQDDITDTRGITVYTDTLTNTEGDDTTGTNEGAIAIANSNSSVNTNANPTGKNSSNKSLLSQKSNPKRGRQRGTRVPGNAAAGTRITREAKKVKEAESISVTLAQDITGLRTREGDTGE
jgi:hypothetical protein